MLENNRNRYFEIIREDVFTDDGILVYEDYVEEFEPYNVNKMNKKYANFGAIQLLKFAVKGGNPDRDEKKDEKFQKGYLKSKSYISSELLKASPILETHVSDTLSQSILSPLLRNLTYGKTSLSVWIKDEQTYALVNAGRGDSACNLLFFCRVEESKKLWAGKSS